MGWFAFSAETWVLDRFCRSVGGLFMGKESGGDSFELGVKLRLRAGWLAPGSQWVEMAVLPYPLGILEESVRWVRLVCGPSGCMPFSKKDMSLLSDECL